MCWSGPWGRDWKQSFNCIHVYVYMCFTLISHFGQKSVTWVICLLRKTLICSCWLIGMLLFWVPVASSLAGTSTATGWFFSSIQSYRQARERGCKSTAGDWPQQPHQGMEHTKGAQSPQLCQGAESDSSATACPPGPLQGCSSAAVSCLRLNELLLKKRNYFLIERNFNYESLKTLTRLGIQMRWLLIALPRHLRTKQDNKFVL